MDLGAGLSRLESSSAGKEALAAYFQWILDTQAGDMPRRACFMVNATTELAPHDPDVAKVVRGAQQRLGAAFLRAVQHAIDLGEADSVRDPPETVARLLTCAAMGMSVAAKAGFSRDALSDMSRMALHTLS